MKQEELYDGMCEFCGQVVQYPEKIMQEAKQDPKVAAKLVCECDDAFHFQHKYRAYNKGLTLLEGSCGKKSKKPLEEETMQILKKCLRLIVDRKIKKAVIHISVQEKVSIEYASGKIKVNREEKQTDKNEVEIV